MSECHVGMLYLVDVSMKKISTGETMKHRLLMIGSEASDIERRLDWVFDPVEFKDIALTSVEKVRDKVHFLRTTVIQPNERENPIIARDENSQEIPQNRTALEVYDPNLYAVGIVTTMLAKDEEHALRKVGNALLARTTPGNSKSAASFPDSATLTIEQIPKASGFAKARDVSSESNRAHFVRG